MSDPSMTVLSWVRKRHGGLAPFEADRISRALFAATEALGRPNAFLARELTDGVVHFLADEAGSVPTTEQIGEAVVTVVRELGHPALARVFADEAARRRQAPKPAAPTEVVYRFPAGAPLDQV